jgi:hypothetical protein
VNGFSSRDAGGCYFVLRGGGNEMLPIPRIIDPITVMEIYRTKAETSLIAAAGNLREAIQYIEKIQKVQNQMREQKERGQRVFIGCRGDGE